MRWLAAMLLLVVLPAQTVAASGTPLWVRDQAPLAQLFGLPRMWGGAVLAPDAGVEFRLGVDAANNFLGHGVDDDLLYLDGESLVTTWSMRFGFRPGWEAWVAYPHVQHSGGVLDGLIDGFHDLFGFDSVGRERVPRNQFDYLLIVDDEAWVDLQSRVRGSGDVRLGIAAALHQDAERQLALRAQLKLPTGSSDRMSGSGATDLALWLEYSQAQFWWHRLGLSAGGGMVLLGEGDLVPDRQLRTLWLGHLGLQARLGQHWSLLLQVDSHQQLYDSALRQLGYHALLGSLGFRRDGTRFSMAWVLTEDIRPDSSADLALHWTLTSRH